MDRRLKQERDRLATLKSVKELGIHCNSQFGIVKICFSRKKTTIIQNQTT